MVGIFVQAESLGPSLLLYHGCRFRQIDGILRDGFDPTFAGEKGGKFFGPGIYFSDVAAKVCSHSLFFPFNGCLRNLEKAIR